MSQYTNPRCNSRAVSLTDDFGDYDESDRHILARIAVSLTHGYENKGKPVHFDADDPRVVV